MKLTASFPSGSSLPATAVRNTSGSEILDSIVVAAPKDMCRNPFSGQIEAVPPQIREINDPKKISHLNRLEDLLYRAYNQFAEKNTDSGSEGEQHRLAVIDAASSILSLKIDSQLPHVWLILSSILHAGDQIRNFKLENENVMPTKIGCMEMYLHLVPHSKINPKAYLIMSEFKRNNKKLEFYNVSSDLNSLGLLNRGYNLMQKEASLDHSEYYSLAMRLSPNCRLEHMDGSQQSRKDLLLSAISEIPARLPNHHDIKNLYQSRMIN